MFCVAITAISPRPFDWESNFEKMECESLARFDLVFDRDGAI